MGFWRRRYGDLYLLFPNIINFIYRLKYLSHFGQGTEGVYFDKWPSAFKKIKIGRNSSSSNVIRTITFSPEYTQIEVGSYTRIGENLYLMLNSRHTPNFVSSHMNRLFFDNYDEKYDALYRSKKPNKAANIAIGNDVWIGNDVKIIGSRRIGDGAVVAAGAVVTHDVEPYEIVGGTPAKRIGYRFSKGIREKLLKIQWWDWSDSMIKQNLGYFYNPTLFVKKHRRNG
ncbi:MAG: antibiotic acetyltransferase [Candidatus Micrarchaeota archaeon]|nr:antibiotic acetyltransferase [Candidatus Micrarchaeota archaeon]